MPWSINIVRPDMPGLFLNMALRTFILGCSLLCLVVPAHAADGKAEGQSSGNTVLQHFGSKSTLNSNLSVPMTNASTDMKTIDGKTSFSAALGSPSTNQFLQVLIQPSGSGDLSKVIVAQDLDSDGSFDHTLDLGALGVPVSGICANGFISCQPGTWLGCQPYTWVSDSAGVLAVNPTEFSQLGGCYCINSSCGSSLVWSNSALVLKDLGGGAVAAIHAQDATVAITSVKTDVVTITYYGQLLKNTTTAKDKVTSLSTIPSTPQLQNYYSNWPQLSADASSVPMSNSGNPDSMYYKLMNSSVAQGSASTRNCSIVRNGVITTTPTATFTGSGSASVCTDHMLLFMMKQGNNEIDLKYVDAGKFGLSDLHHNCGDDPGGDGWHQLSSVNVPSSTANLQVNLTKARFDVSNMQGPTYIDLTDNLRYLCSTGGTASTSQFDSAVQASMSCPASGAQTVSFDWTYIFEYSTDSYQESVNNGCSVMESDTTCRVQDETVDGVMTVRNFNATGLLPLPTKQTFIGAGPPLEMFRPWWKKNRTYVCKNQTGFDLSAVKKRYNSVVTTAADTDTTLNFTDVRQDANGNWVTEPSSVTKISSDPLPECEPACKVRRPKTDTQVGTSGITTEVVSGKRYSNSSFDTLYKPCIDGGTTCSVDLDAGEYMIDNCKCVNEFGMAASTMQMLRLGGADSVCSSGTPVPP